MPTSIQLFKAESLRLQRRIAVPFPIRSFGVASTVFADGVWAGPVDREKQSNNRQKDIDFIESEIVST